jgi:hypothetical protein
MGYLYGGILLALIAAGLAQRGKFTIVRVTKALTPAVVSALAICVVVLARFGPMPMVRSLFPTAGARAYSVLHYGWGGIEKFLYFPGVKVAYYIGSTATLWAAASIYVVAAAAFSGIQSLRDGRLLRNTEIIVTCALLHICFVTLFFGSPSSWTYYAYILIIGVAATTELWTFAPAVVLVFCVLAALVDLAQTRDAFVMWRELDASPATAGLYAPPAEKAEWERVSVLGESERPTMLHELGGVEVLFPWLGEPEGAFLLPGIATPGEIAREQERLKFARMIIVPDLPAFRNELVEAAQSPMYQAFSDAHLTFDGKLFRVYERSRH